MLRSLYTGISGLRSHQVRLDVVSNNIANVNTTGFKSSRARFSDIISQTIEIATSPGSGRGGQNPKQIGLGVLGATITRDMGQGSIELTNRTTDLAIQGGGMFILRDGETIGEWYTRDGHFNVDSEGSLVLASNGYRVQGWNGFFDPLSGTFTMDSSNPVEDEKIDLVQQMGPQATSTIEFGANLDSRLDTAIDPMRLKWAKNGTEREIEVRFTHAHPTKQYYVWEMFDPGNIDATTGDMTRITTDTNGTAVQGIIELDPDTGKIIRNFINTADDNTADSETRFISDLTNELPTNADIWASVNTVNTFNGFDFVSLTTENDGNNFAVQDNERALSQVVSTVANTITVDYSDDPFSQVASTNFPNGFVLDAVLDITGAPAPLAGTTGIPGNGLGMPVQYIDTVTNEVSSKRFNVDVGGGVIRTIVQLDNDNIISTNRLNPDQKGIMSLTGTDADSLRIFIDGTEYTRVNSTTNFVAGSTQFVLNPDAGIVEINGQISPGTNIISTYSHDLRANSNYSVAAGTTIDAAFEDPAAGPPNLNIGFATAATNGTTVRTLGTTTDNGDGSIFYKAGSASSLALTDVSATVTETFTEIAFVSVGGTAITPGANQYSINSTTGAITFGTFSSGAAVATATDTIGSFSFSAYRGTRDNNAPGANNVITGVGGLNNQYGRSDLWRVQQLPAGGSETSTVQVYLQGDYGDFDGNGTPEIATANPDAETLSFLLPFSSSTPSRRVELNYEADDRVNIIIPNGLTKTPNINAVTDLTAEAFSFGPNTTQITGNAGNNNQADTGDSVTNSVNEPEKFKYSTAIEVYDSLGTPHNVPLRFEHLSDNKWMVYAIDPTDADGERVAFQRILAFDENGKFDLTSSVPYESPLADGTLNDGFQGIYFDPAQAGGAAPPEEGAVAVQISPDFTNLVQTARQPDAVVQSSNGFPPGRLETFSFNDQGFLVGLFDNGRSLNLARVALQVFVNPAGVVGVGGNMFKDTVNAGKLGSPQRPGFDGAGSIIPGSLEQSNVDLSVEFVDLIVTQRGFQAQSRTITTSDQILQEILSLKR